MSFSYNIQKRQHAPSRGEREKRTHASRAIGERESEREERREREEEQEQEQEQEQEERENVGKIGKEEEIKRREIHFGRNLEKVPQGRKSSGENHD